jgi:HSP20 family protein
MAASDVGDRYALEAELPGVRMEDLEITCIDRTLTIRGERLDQDGSGMVYERRERPVGTFLRSVEFPEDVDAAKTEATLEDGILRILVPKAERAGPRRIEIRSSARTAGTSAPAKKEEK